MRSVHRALELALAAVAASAIVANFFSFFTIESNLIVIASLIVPWPPLRGAATVYIVIVGIVYSALLANKRDDVTRSQSTGSSCRRPFAIVGWYPYPFVNPENSSYATVGIVCAAIALFAAVVSVILLRYARRRTATA